MTAVEGCGWARCRRMSRPCMLGQKVFHPTVVNGLDLLRIGFPNELFDDLLLGLLETKAFVRHVFVLLVSPRPARRLSFRHLLGVQRRILGWTFRLLFFC